MSILEISLKISLTHIIKNYFLLIYWKKSLFASYLKLRCDCFRTSCASRNIHTQLKKGGGGKEKAKKWTDMRDAKGRSCERYNAHRVFLSVFFFALRANTLCYSSAFRPVRTIPRPFVHVARYSLVSSDAPDRNYQAVVFRVLGEVQWTEFNYMNSSQSDCPRERV